MRKALAILAGLAVLGAANWTIYERERHLAQGAVVLLELAPLDPRSLMQGDYMALRFKVEVDAFGSTRKEDLADGRIVVRQDERGVAAFVRRDAGEPLAANELRLRYRVRAGRVKFATNAFFFQEGHARRYERARYGEFRASPSGELLLTHLRGEDLERLGPR
ncbi:MAG: GDYXXLXY domain-containing protein [Betaproteobacteria bacterium]|nr:GDYXXLXY domain-containing protein [Betaproteobacteria bacterium]